MIVETPDGRLSRHLLGTSRSCQVWTLTALNLILALALFAAAFVPATMHRFKAEGLIFGTLFGLTAIAVWLSAPRFGRTALFAFSLVGVVLLSAADAKARTPQGSLVGSFPYLWTTIYAASFLSRRETYAILGAIAAGSGAAFAAASIPHWAGIWVLFAVTTTTTGVILESSVGQLRRDAQTDVLTGLLNRRGFLQAAMLECSVSERAGISLAIVVIDLDDFKSVNDLHGHAAGDRLLIEATRAWQKELRAGDLCARFGGDEFVLLLPHLPASGVEAVIARCHAAHPIAWTSGTAFMNRGESIEECMQRADSLLYQAKMRRGISSFS